MNKVWRNNYVRSYIYYFCVGGEGWGLGRQYVTFSKEKEFWGNEDKNHQQPSLLIWSH